MTIPLIYKPFASHFDSFRQILHLWSCYGLCDVIQYNGRYVWWGKPGEVILFDNDQVKNGEPFPDNKGILFSNETPQSDYQHKWSKWTFWVRWPLIVENNYWNRNLGFQYSSSRLASLPRHHKSIFLGKVENEEQKANRFRYHKREDLEQVIDTFWCTEALHTPTNTHMPVSPESYYELLSQSIFGLCLPGYGPKCNREIEYAAMGVIPILTEGCSVDYSNPWKENENYLFAKTTEEISDITRNTTEADRLRIQKNNFEWFWENCYSQNAFKITQTIISGLPK